MMSLIDSWRGRLLVSCQAYPGEPMQDPRTTAQMALSVVAGRAAAVRVQGLDDVRATVAVVDVPVIGLWKVGDRGVCITPTLQHAAAVAESGAVVVALDGTRRPRPDGLSLAQTVSGLKERAPVLVMADCGSVDDALAAQDAGVDVLGTTLAGYTDERRPTMGPDLDLLDDLLDRVDVPVVVEGRVRTPEQAAEALSRGAHAVCVGTAITHPASITRWFADAVESASGKVVQETGSASRQDRVGRRVAAGRRRDSR